jgi:stage II sporulation protein R
MRFSHYSHSSLFAATSKFTIIGFVFFLGLSALLGHFASASTRSLIPEDAIRIRIIANSDNKADQQLKYNVRDDVAAFIESWGVMPSLHDEARNLITSHLEEIQQHVDTKLREYGASYGGVVELSKVPFPEKMFDNTSYAAGDYEALRITLGKGDGVNWWCVLFPPLCLTAATASDDKSTEVEIAATKGKPSIDKVKSTGKVSQTSSTDNEPKPKFFLWEILRKLFAFLKSLFS